MGGLLYPETLKGAGELAREEGGKGTGEEFETQVLAEVLLRARAVARWEELAHSKPLVGATDEVAALSALARTDAALGNRSGAQRLADRLRQLEAEALRVP